MTGGSGRARVLRAGWHAAGLLALVASMAPACLAQADEVRARKIVMGSCFVCHGAEGESSSEAYPRLAGQHAEYIAKQLDNFKSGKRKSSAMAPMVANLTADEMLAVGRYFERQKLEPQPPEDPVLAVMGADLYHNGNPRSSVPACASCHGSQGQGTAVLPRLAGQFASYTQAQLKLFNQRERTNDNAVMHAIVQKMTAREMAAVAHYLSSK